MYIYKLRQKSTGLFVVSIDMWGNLHTTSTGKIYSDKRDVKLMMLEIQYFRKELSSYSNKGQNTSYVEKVKLLRPNNFEVVTYFCTEHSVTKP